MNANNTSDYFKFHEFKLQKKTSQFFNKCDSIESKIQCLHKVIQQYFFEENFDASEDPLSKIENRNECLRREYDNQLREFEALHEVKNLLDGLLNYVIKEEPEKDDEKDMELLGLSFIEQKTVMLRRLDGLRQCKDMGRKILKKMQHKLIYYQSKAHETTLSAVSMTDFYKSKLVPIKVIENGINNEITRIKSEFSKKYEKLVLIKLRCEKNDIRMRVELIPKITNLETSLMVKRNKLEMTQREIAERLRDEKIQGKIDDEFEKKLKVLNKEYDKVVEDNNSTSDEIEELKRSIIKTIKSIKSIRKKFLDEIIEMNQDAAVDEKMMELFDQNESLNICYTTNSTIHKLSRHDASIVNLRKLICGMLEKISKSTSLINILQADLIFLRNEHRKYSVGRDYMGNTIMTPKTV